MTRSALAAGLACVACTASALLLGSCASAPQPPPPHPATEHTSAAAARSTPAHPRRPHRAASLGPRTVPVIAATPARLAVQLTEAEKALSEGKGSPAALARQALTTQLACLKLAAHPGWATQVIDAIGAPWRATASTDIAATADLVALTPPEPRLPPWRIIGAKSQAALRADYHAAQAATGVAWWYLAAINFVETDFGRIIGPSSAGAQGPMQFMPATWASYGRGDIYNPRAAIMAAARFLLAHGAPGAIRTAVYAYNPSSLYVDAVLRYVARLRSDPHAFTSYYRRQIIYRLGPGWVWLPPGYGTNSSIQAEKLPGL